MKDEYLDIIAAIGKGLYDHWQREVGETARVAWEDATPHMVRVFEDKAEIAFVAYWDHVG